MAWWSDRHAEWVLMSTVWCRNGRSLGGHDSWPWTRVFPASTCPCVWRIAEWFKEAFVYGVKNSFTSLLEVVHNLLPEDNTLPKSYYKAKKILCPMGVDYQKIHACPNDCILYMHEFQEMSKCPICGTSRYKVKDEEESSSDENSNKVPPAKVLWYLPIIPRFKRLFSNEDDAKDLTCMQMEEFLMEWSVIRLIARSGRRLMVCIRISEKSQEILDLV